MNEKEDCPVRMGILLALGVGLITGAIFWKRKKKRSFPVRIRTRLKEEPAGQFLTVSKRLRIPEIPAFAEAAIAPLQALAQKLNLKVTDDLVFIYYNADGDPKTEFKLSIGLPVDVSNQTGSAPEGYELESLPAFRFLSFNYEGTMAGIGQAWAQLAHDFHAKNLKVAVQSREVYRKWIARESPHNLTELQMGIG